MPPAGRQPTTAAGAMDDAGEAVEDRRGAGPGAYAEEVHEGGRAERRGDLGDARPPRTVGGRARAAQRVHARTVREHQLRTSTSSGVSRYSH